MKYIILVLLVSIISSACTDPAKQFIDKYAGADSIVINFFKANGQMDTVTAVKIIRDKKSIEEITAMIAAGPASVNNKCIHQGSIHFFKNDRVVQDVFFSSSNEACRQFLFRLNGKDAATELDDKAKAYLLRLKSQ